MSSFIIIYYMIGKNEDKGNLLKVFVYAGIFVVIVGGVMWFLLGHPKYIPSVLVLLLVVGATARYESL